MERIEQLLDRYFNGTTTLHEEKELRKYFSSGIVHESYKIYQPLFEVFAEEKLVSMPAPVQQPKIRSTRARLLIITSAVASVTLVAMWFLTPQRLPDNYIVIHGNRINNEQLALQYAEGKLSEVTGILNKNMQPVRHTEEKIINKFKPLSKTENTLRIISDYNIMLTELTEKKD